MDAHEVLQAEARNATWLNEILPVIDGPKNIAEVLTDASHIGFMLSNCGRVRYDLSRKIRISTQFDNYIHGILSSQVLL